MPALLETQRALRDQLFAVDPDALPARVLIYRNTCQSTLAKALRLSYPVVARLVGDEFFDAAAHAYLATHLPAAAYLNDYGAQFAHFLASVPGADSVPYLSDVAQLEWAVNRALHATDCAALEVARLAALPEADLERVCLTPHPALSVLALEYPADQIWRAVLDQDALAMAGIDLAAGSVQVLVERGAQGVQLRRLTPAQAQFTRQLISGTTLADALPAGAADSLQPLLAEHLASGRFIEMHLAQRESLPSTGEYAA